MIRKPGLEGTSPGCAVYALALALAGWAILAGLGYLAYLIFGAL